MIAEIINQTLAEHREILSHECKNEMIMEIMQYIHEEKKELERFLLEKKD